jgi:Transglutaminase-like superfamily
VSRTGDSMLLVLHAFMMLVTFQIDLARGNFASLYQKVRAFPIRRSSKHDVERICSAVDLACIWYPKEVLCLQRSAVTACLLRRCGVPAQMVVGASLMPFRAHAWVEVNGVVVNDKAYVSDMYAVLDRC